MAKLNLKFFKEQQKNRKSSIILYKETLLAQVGFNYYNLYRNSQYEQDKTVYLAKSIEYLEYSYKNNVSNYVVCFTLAKVYASSMQLEKALEFAI